MICDVLTCDVLSPGGTLRCIREPHDGEGHVWQHPTWQLHNAKEDAAAEDR
jgi:hypothetical protein